VALSGGGHRATLFSLGALLYLVDAGCSKHVDSVVSVSGGSITNAAVAHGCDFSTVDVEEFDRVAARIASTIVHRGVLFSAASTYAFLVVCGLLASYLVVESVFDWPVDLPWWAALSGLAVVASALSLRGHLLARLLEREYLAAQRPKLGDLDRQVAHVFAATDLNSGAPIYFSTAAGGIIDSPVLKTAPCPSLAVADVVRASAAFPGGFPPKRLSLARSGLVWTSRTEGLDDFERRFGWIGRTRRGTKAADGETDVPRSLRPPRALFLSDGGVWNNLGTDWTPPLGKDHVPGPRVRLVVDASAPVASRRMGGLNVPGLAEGLAIFRTMSVLYSNTVEPRVKALDGEAAQAMRERALGRGHWSLPAVIRVVDGREQLMRRYSRICRHAGVDRERDLFRGPNGEVADLWGWLYKTHHTIHGKTRPGLRLWNSTVGTTLGRVERNTAISLLMHGYVGAMTVLHAYAALPFAPRGRLDIDRFSRLVDGKPSTTPAFSLKDADRL
jgi:predicted acylesterase/phospholipase RssA